MFNNVTYYTVINCPVDSGTTIATLNLFSKMADNSGEFYCFFKEIKCGQKNNW